MCNTWFGFTGALCNERCVQADSALAVNLMASLLAVGVFAAAGLLLTRLILARTSLKRLSRKGGLSPRRLSIPRFYLNPVAVTLLFCLLGSVALVMSNIANSLVRVGFPDLYIVVNEKGSNRRLKRASQYLDNFNGISLPLAYCLCACAIVILPLTWVSYCINGESLNY
jgi:hypothetical protein